MVLRKLSQSLKFFLAVMVTVFSSGLMPSSVAYAAVNGGNEDCPAGTTLFEKYEWKNGAYTLDGSDGTTVSVSGNATAGTFSVASGYAVSDVLIKGSTITDTDHYDPAVTSGSFNNTQLTSVNPGNGRITTHEISNLKFCGKVTTTTVAPQEPSVTPVCGPNNDTVVLPTQTGVNYSQTGWANNSNTVTATAQANYILSGTTSWTFTDQNTACPPQQITTPSVDQSVVCGPNNDTYSVVDGPNYNVVDNGNGTFTLTADTGYVFSTSGTNTATLTAPADQNTACPKVVICHRTNAVVNPYNKIEVSVEAADGQAGNSGNQPDHYGEHQGPVFDPSVHDNGDDWGDIIPPIDGAHSGYNWTAEGQAIYYNDCNVPDDNEGEPELTFDYSDVCTEDSDGAVSVEIDNDGNAAANDLVVNLYDENGILLDTHTVDVPAGDDVEVEFGGLTEGTYTIRVFDGNTLLSSEDLEVDECGGGIIDVCPNIGGVQLFIPSGLVKDDNGDCVTDQCPLVPGVQTNTILCPPGQGGDTPTTPGQTLGASTTTTPQVLSTSTELPATLPATGGSMNPLMIVLASVIAYGAAYFLQGRRQLAREQA